MPPKCQENGNALGGQNLENKVARAGCQELRAKKDGVSRLVEDCSSNQPTYPRLKFLKLVHSQIIER